MKRLVICSICLILTSFLRASTPQSHASPDRVPEGIAKSDWRGIRAAYEAGRHQFFKQDDGTHMAKNPGLAWQMVFDAKGFTARPDAGGWEWGLELILPEQTKAGQSVAAFGSKLSMPRTPALTEWFVNDQRGLEQGWTLTEPAEIRLRVRGDLKAGVTPQSVTFGGQITYSGLKAWDANGKTIPTHFESTEDGFAVRYIDAGAQYPITIDPIAQQAYLKASNTQTNDQFGIDVAISGDTVVVGANWEDSNAAGVNGNHADNSAANSGAAYVFTRSGTSWTLDAYLKASNPGANDQFGQSVAVSGDTVIVGARYEDSIATGVNGSQTNNSSSDSGATYIFIRSGGTWMQQSYVKASNTGPGDNFGYDVAVWGDTVVVGATGEDSNANVVNGNQANNSFDSAGAAYVFTRNGSDWTQQSYLKASNASTFDGFGNSVAISSDTVVIGAFNDLSGSGSAYVFERSGINWTQQAFLRASNPGSGDQFGHAVAISGNTVVVGAHWEASNATGVNGNQANDSFFNAGAAYVFERNGTNWTQQAYLKASNTEANDNFGQAVAVWGDTVIVGADLEDSNGTGIDGNQTNNSLSAAGAAYVFNRYGATWSQQAYLKSSNTGDNRFSFSLAISGKTLIVGAYGERSNATGVNGNQADTSASASGAAFVFTGLGPTQEGWRQAYFATTSNSGNAADSFDFDDDGLVNLIEYAFGLDPSSGGSNQLPSGQMNGGSFVISFTPPSGVTGITYGAEWSPTLSPANWTPVTNTGTPPQQVFSEPIGANTKMFMRLKVTSP